ncbi:MAG: N-acetylmuramoyl-L-alanine amidase [Gemmatimonadota bacterium]|nr:N-acetylmuramoyl-L-alanine amidase [Gemmatimonadota bacterium]
MTGARAAALIGLVAVAVGCGGKDTTAPTPTPVVRCISSSASHTQSVSAPVTDIPTKYDSLFVAAANEFGVSSALLKSVAYVETRWQMVQGEEEFEGRPAAFGVMALRGERLTKGAARAGVSVRAAKYDAAANIRAAAALIAAGGLDAVTDIALPEGRAAFAREVDAARGVPGARLQSQVAPNGCPTPTVDFATSLWRPSPNYNTRTTGISMIIIHTCEGGYTGCWSWLVNPASQVSAHYVVNESGSEVSQLVREKDRAWQIAATYNCALNQNLDCAMNGTQMNHMTIGIEHAGYASQDSFPTSQLQKSAQLVCDITKRQGIPRDSLHILGHGQMQPANRTDPGPRWPWNRYIAMIRSACGDS